MIYTVEIVKHRDDAPRGKPTGERWTAEEVIVLLPTEVIGRTAEGATVEPKDMVSHWIRMGRQIQQALPHGFVRALVTAVVVQAETLNGVIAQREEQRVVTVERVLSIIRTLDRERELDIHDEVVRTLKAIHAKADKFLHGSVAKAKAAGATTAATTTGGGAQPTRTSAGKKKAKSRAGKK